MENVAYVVLHNLCPSSDIIRMMIKLGRMRWAGHVAYGRAEKACKVSVRKAEGNRSLQKPTHR
jgi:hypothetical protein